MTRARRWAVLTAGSTPSPGALSTKTAGSTQAYLGFSKVDEAMLDSTPIIPEDLLPSLPDIDVKTLRENDSTDDARLHELYDTIIAGGTTEQLIAKMVHGEKLNTPLSEMEGGTCLHAAAVSGRLNAVYLLQYAGANINAVDN
ncbi:unnamed protein product [Leptidea sinapis]|uniref:Uncharacterized protein n=1 Tax=Leptidea sinapis TaxID=189913 RepID=A0A5E4R096_9NEOP|nr:unnamed protein product [Leptidea sinapis]